MVFDRFLRFWRFFRESYKIFWDMKKLVLKINFFLSEFSFTDTESEVTMVYSSLPLSPAHENSDIYLQLSMWNYHIFLIVSHLICYPMRFTTSLIIN